MNTVEFLINCVAFACDGILKSATGAGAPITVVPLLAMYNGVHIAVTVIVIPNIIPNLVQAYRFHQHIESDL